VSDGADRQIELLVEIRDLLREDVRLRQQGLAEQRMGQVAVQRTTGRLILVFLGLALLWVIGSSVAPLVLGH